MENIIGPGNHLRYQLLIENGSLDQAAIESVKIGAVSGAEVVQHDDIGLVLVVFDQMAADESRPAGDDDFHPATSRTSFSMAASCASMLATNANCVRQRSRLCPARLVLK